MNTQYEELEKKKEQKGKQITRALTWMSAVAVLLITVPSLMVIFYKIPTLLFKTLNTAGIILAGIRIVISGAMSTTAIGLKTETTDFKKSLDKEAKLLLVMVLLIQLFNLAFIHE